MSLPASLQKSLAATKVDYVRLGTSGLKVSVPILGAMSLGSKAWLPWVIDEEGGALEILKAAYDRGINSWDTANMYSNGVSEELIGKAIKKYDIPRSKLVIMTKCFVGVGEDEEVKAIVHGKGMAKSKDYVNHSGLSRNAIFQQVEASLKRLDTTYIDLFQIHRYDDNTPPEETMRALHDLVSSGKVRYIGASSMWAYQFAKMQNIAEKYGYTKFVSMQNYYNLCYREEEREMLKLCKEQGVGVIPWSPLFQGKLARPIGPHDSIRANDSTRGAGGLTPADEEIVKRVEEIAKSKGEGWTMANVALAWLKSKDAIPIMGINSVARVDDATTLTGKTLTEEEIKKLEEPYQPKAIAGHS